MPDLPPPPTPSYLQIEPAPIPPLGLSFTNTMAIVSSTGQVSIDWARVEAVASAPDSPFADRFSKQIARLLLAVRDKTYQPIKP